LAVIALVLTSCAQDPPEMNLELLLERHGAARGGATAIESIRSIELTVEIIEPEFTLAGQYIATRDQWMRVGVYADGARVFTEALGPDGGWQMFDDGTVADLSPDGKDALLRGVASNLYGLHELPGLGYQLAFLGSTVRHDQLYWEIEQTSPDGFAQRLFLDKKTYLIASKVETSALHPDLDSDKTYQETFFSNYRDEKGVLIARRSVKKNIKTGDIMQEATVTRVSLNIEPEQARFERPESPPPVEGDAR